MRKFGEDLFTIICTISAFITSVIIILTFLTTYHFINSMPIFTSYAPLQIGICITMALWGIRFLLNKVRKERYIYSIICITISIVSVFFLINLII